MLRALTYFRKGLARVLEWGLIFAFAILTLDVLWGVFSRYVLGHQTSWTDDLATVLLIWISMLGAALAYGEKGHLGVDYFESKLDPSAQKVLRFFVDLIVLGFAGVVMVYGGYSMAHRSLTVGQTMPVLPWLKGYIYMATPLSGLLICVYAIENLIEQVVGRQTPPDDSDQASKGGQDSDAVGAAGETAN